MTTLKDLKSASRAEVFDIIRESLPAGLDENQKLKKVSNILSDLKRSGKIDSEGNGRSARWFLL